jgi:hypothetical protein
MNFVISIIYHGSYQKKYKYYHTHSDYHKFADIKELYDFEKELYDILCYIPSDNYGPGLYSHRPTTGYYRGSQSYYALFPQPFNEL